MIEVLLLGLLAAASGTSSADLAQEPPPREERLRAQKTELRARLEAELATDLGPRIANELNRLLDPAKGAKQGGFLRVESGWVSTKMAHTFLALNPDWAGPSVHWTVDLAGPTVTTVVDLHRQLAEHGVELIVIPVPTRLNVEPDVLEGVSLEESRAGFAPGLKRWMLALTGAGVEVLDLLPVLAEARAGGLFGSNQIFLEVNNHWGPDGASIAARALAARLSSRAWFSEIAPAEVETGTRLDPVCLPWTHPAQELPPGVPAPQLLFERVLGPDGKFAPDRERDSPVVILGDSFTTMFQLEGADFARQLHHRMGFAADVIALPGGGARTARDSFARRQNPLEGKRVVVWMFAPWALRNPGWSPIPLSR